METCTLRSASGHMLAVSQLRKAQMMSKGFSNARYYRCRRKVLLGREVQVVANLKADLFFIDLVSSFSLVVCHTSSHFINTRLLSHILFLLFLLYFRTFVVHSSNNVILCSPPLGSIFSSTKYIKTILKFYQFTHSQFTTFYFTNFE